MSILDYINLYKIPASIIAVAVICFIGILKVIKLFEKLTNKDIKKGVYFLLSVGLSFAGAAIYYHISNFAWNTYWIYGICQAAITTVLYALYEDLGPRKLIQLLFTWVASWFKKSEKTVSLAYLSKLGLSEEFINRLEESLKAELNRVTSTNTEAIAKDETEITVKTK